MFGQCPVCGDDLIVVENDDPGYGPPTLYFCETAGASHIPFNWTPESGWPSASLGGLIAA